MSIQLSNYWQDAEILQEVIDWNFSHAESRLFERLLYKVDDDGIFHDYTRKGNPVGDFWKFFKFYADRIRLSDGTRNSAKKKFLAHNLIYDDRINVKLLKSLSEKAKRSLKRLPMSAFHPNHEEMVKNARRKAKKASAKSAGVSCKKMCTRSAKFAE
jgi:hypothetical protein